MSKVKIGFVKFPLDENFEVTFPFNSFSDGDHIPVSALSHLGNVSIPESFTRIVTIGDKPISLRALSYPGVQQSFFKNQEAIQKLQMISNGGNKVIMKIKKFPAATSESLIAEDFEAYELFTILSDVTHYAYILIHKNGYMVASNNLNMLGLYMLGGSKSPRHRLIAKLINNDSRYRFMTGLTYFTSDLYHEFPYDDLLYCGQCGKFYTGEECYCQPTSFCRFCNNQFYLRDMIKLDTGMACNECKSKLVLDISVGYSLKKDRLRRIYTSLDGEDYIYAGKNDIKNYYSVIGDRYILGSGRRINVFFESKTDPIFIQVPLELSEHEARIRLRLLDKKDFLKRLSIFLNGEVNNAVIRRLKNYGMPII